jgi:uncharacterized protein YaeQ
MQRLRMTFVAAFYNFTIELNHSDRNVYTTFRLKTPRHELETHAHLYARLIAYLHCYRAGIDFSRGVSEPKEPTIWLKDAIEQIQLWAQVGVPEKRKLELSLKQHPTAEHRVYFYQEGDVERFCHHLRGSKTNWVKEIQFYQLDPIFLERLATLETTSPLWSISFIDNRIYLTLGHIDLESEVTPIDIWDAFQQSLIREQIAS